mmetsp:Transcript_20984/g.44827  ORF Transcript_20984/g.44827 Transcript_20984/m.44827 type:complete len:240 (-) Transcript_20984:238-957(-)
MVGTAPPIIVGEGMPGIPTGGPPGGGGKNPQPKGGGAPGGGPPIGGWKLPGGGGANPGGGLVGGTKASGILLSPPILLLSCWCRLRLRPLLLLLLLPRPPRSRSRSRSRSRPRSREADLPTRAALPPPESGVAAMVTLSATKGPLNFSSSFSSLKSGSLAILFDIASWTSAMSSSKQGRNSASASVDPLHTKCSRFDSGVALPPIPSPRSARDVAPILSVNFLKFSPFRPRIIPITEPG